MTQHQEQLLKKAIFSILDTNGKIVGTGFFISPEGYAITCCHVIDPLVIIRVKDALGFTYTAIQDIEKSVPALDIAVMKIDVDNVPYIPLSLREVPIGSKIWISGFHYFGENIKDMLPVTGAIAGTTEVEFSAGKKYRIEAWKINVDTIDGGLSGAPLLLLSTGNAIGLCNAKFGIGGGFAASFNRAVKVYLVFGQFLKDQLQQQVNPVLLEQVRRSIAYLTDSKKFLSEQYCPREREEQSINAFLAGNARLFPIIGNAGVGKSSMLCVVAQRCMQHRPTIFLLGFELELSSYGLRGEVEKILAGEQSITDLEMSRRLVIIIDGFNEITKPENLKSWVKKTALWIMEQRIQLILSCRPDFWELYACYFPENFLQKTENGDAGIVLSDFDGREFALALKRYLLPEAFSRKEKLRHPLLLRMLWNLRIRPAVGDEFSLSYYSIFDRYISEKCLALGADLNVSAKYIRSQLYVLANKLNKRRNYWLSCQEYYALFSVPELGDRLISENLLAVSKDTVRIVFDQLAEFLIAQALEVDLTKIDWSRMSDDSHSLIRCVIPFAVAKREADEEDISKFLDDLAGKIREFQEPMPTLQIFVDIVSCLRFPTLHFSTIEGLFIDLEKEERGYSYDSTIERLLRNAPMAFEFRMRLIRIGLLNEEYYGWEMKRWLKMEAEDFMSSRLKGWRGAAGLLYEELMTNRRDTLLVVAGWLEDHTGLASGRHVTAAGQLRDLAAGVLFQFRQAEFDLVATSFARAFLKEESGSPGNALVQLAVDNADLMTWQLVQWKDDPEFLVVFCRCARVILTGDRREEFYGELSPILMEILARKGMKSSAPTRSIFDCCCALLPFEKHRQAMITEILVLLREEELYYFFSELDPYMNDYFDLIFPDLDTYIRKGKDRNSRQSCLMLLFEGKLFLERQDFLLALFERYLDELQNSTDLLMYSLEIMLRKCLPNSEGFARALGIAKRSLAIFSEDDIVPVIQFLTGEELFSEKQKPILELLKWVVDEGDFPSEMLRINEKLIINCQDRLDKRTLVEMLTWIWAKVRTIEDRSQIRWIFDRYAASWLKEELGKILE